MKAASGARRFALRGLFDLDRVGWLQLALAFVYSTAMATAMSMRLVAGAKQQHFYSSSTWMTSLWIGAAVGLALAVAALVTWQRRGGQRCVRASDRAVVTGALPGALASRVAVLRELERRDKLMDTQTSGWVPLVAWTICSALWLSSDRSPANVVGTTLFWGFALSYCVPAIMQRRRRPHILAMIDELRADPAGLTPRRPDAADSVAR